MLNGHTDTDRARDALHYLPPDRARDQWVKAGMAFHAAGGDFDSFDQWSAGADSYEARACRETWRSFKTEPGGVTAGALFGMARDHGWQDNSASDRPAQATPSKAAKRPPEPRPKPAHSVNALAVWERCTPAKSHAYGTAKGASVEALQGLRVVPDGDPLRIIGESMAGALVVPCWDGDSLATLQFITAGATAARLKAAGKPSKLNLPGPSLAGASFTIGTDGPVYLCEGIGAAWSAWQSTGHRAVVCFGWGNVGKVAATLRQQDPTAKLVLCPDTGKESDAQKIALEHDCLVAAMPEGWPANSDVNDLFQRDGFDVVQALLESATNPPAPPLPLSVAFADELSDTFTPPDELVQGLLAAGDGSIMYGDSNTGKTFVIVDLACSVARGVPWMDRQTEPGLVVYLAAESPASVRSRLQAYQRHHGVKVPNFAIVQNPIDLFDGDGDTNKVIQTIKRIESERGQKARLIVGDTLARLSAGANENAGADMGLVVRRFDRIRTETGAHFCMVHHSGKNQANGARGWSGVRAAVDTEIELTDTPQGKCIEITKQRDLPSKGDRIGFRLDVVTLGHTKWGFAATSCVVVPADAPEKAKGKRLSECDGAVLEFLAAKKIGVRKTEVVKHFADRYEKGPIYRALKALVTAGAIHEAAGMVCIAEVAK